MMNTEKGKAIDYSRDGVIVSHPNLEDNPLIYIHKCFEKTTGYSMEEIVGEHCGLLQEGNKNHREIEKLRRAIEEGKICEVEFLNYKKNGEELWNELNITPIFNKKGKIEYFFGVQKDITERKKTEEIMHLYKKIFENTLQGVMITDAAANIILVNDAFTTTTGYSSHEVQGKNPSLLSSGKHGESFYNQLWRDLKEYGQWQGEIWNKRKSGEIYPELLNISEVKNKNGQLSNYVAIFTDITESKNREHQLARLSIQDSLTGIANRRKFDHYLVEKWDILMDIQEPISLILLDLDFFKLYNDTYGHQAGDRCLIQVAEVLEKSVRKMDLVARYGGEELAVVLPQCDMKKAEEIAENIRKNIELKQIQHKHSKVSNVVTVSIGVATLIPSEKWDSTSLINQADQALYKAKQKGKNRVEVY